MSICLDQSCVPASPSSLKGARGQFWPSTGRMPPGLVEGRGNRQALDEESMHSLPVEDLEDAMTSRGTGRWLSRCSGPG
jgi:hypothetical protein